MTVSPHELRRAINQVRGILADLERQLNPDDQLDPYVRRKRVLQQIYMNENGMSRNELLVILKELGTSYTWIGQQVKIGYLVLTPTLAGMRYSVTQKAVRELGLHVEEGEEIAGMSEEAFTEDWNSEEDAAYDAL